MTPNPNKILIVEDDNALLQVMQIQLRREGYEVSSAVNADQALEILHDKPQSLIIADLQLPGLSGMDLLRKVRAEHPAAMVILMTAFGTVQSAVESMKSGAYDYITKPIHSYELRANVGLDQKYGFENIIGSSEPLMYALELAARVAPVNVTVLIQGETGTGKDLVAKAIHSLSPRREAPFVTINCAAIPRELLESELFGYVKGAFTGAVTHKMGKAEIADAGTLFMDEIGEMPLELQVRVLRLMQEREIEKVGARTPTKVDVRIIAATHRNLEQMVKEGTFREDLYYRLLVVPIKLPPLRERGKDIAELTQFFFDRCKVKYARPELKLPSDLLARFSENRWPGNVRQLENAVERMVLLSPGPEITPTNLPDFLQRDQPVADEPLIDLPAEGLNLDDVDKQLILRVLDKLGGNQSQAARYLGMSRRTLSYRLEKYGVRRKTLKTHQQGAG